jgi:RNA polymerase sigma factor (sigma-70 family)
LRFALISAIKFAISVLALAAACLAQEGLTVDDRPANNPERRLLNRELSTHILCAFQRLTPRERMVFELKHFQGLRLPTVGQILNTSEASVKTSLFRAAQQLRFQLDGLTTGEKSLMKQRSDTRGVNQLAI